MRSCCDAAERNRVPRDRNAALLRDRFHTPPSGSWTEQYFFYDQEDHLIAVREVPKTGSSVQELYYWNETEPLFRLTLQNQTSILERAYLYNDQQGATRLAVAVDGSMASPVLMYEASRAPFLEGAPLQSPTSPNRPVRLRFPGQWVDEGSGIYSAAGTLLDAQFGDLVANGAREYDPGAGAYTSYEPAMIWGGQAGRSFGYANGNPARFTDPTGTVAVPIILGAAAGGAVWGATGYLAVQWATGQRVDYVDLGIATVFGAVTGGWAAEAQLARAIGIGTIGNIAQGYTTEFGHALRGQDTVLDEGANWLLMTAWWGVTGGVGARLGWRPEVPSTVIGQTVGNIHLPGFTIGDYLRQMGVGGIRQLGGAACGNGPLNPNRVRRALGDWLDNN